MSPVTCHLPPGRILPTPGTRRDGPTRVLRSALRQRWGSPGSRRGAPGASGAHRSALTGGGGATLDGLCVAHGRTERGREGSGGSVRGSSGSRTRSGTALAAIRSCRPAPPRPEPAPPTAAAGGTRAERTGTGSALIGLERFEPSRARFGRVGWAQPEPVQPLSSRPGAIPKVPIPARILCPHQPGTLE